MAITKKQLQEFLAQHPPQMLVDWLHSIAKNMPEFKQRLEYYVATHQSWEAAAQATMEAVEQFSKLQSARTPPKPADFLKQGRFLLESIRACIDFDQSSKLDSLVELMMQAVDGLAGKLSKPDVRVEALQRELAALHLLTLERNPPAPVELADRLFRLRSNAYAAMLPDVPRAYMDLLGADGVKRYRELIDAPLRALLHGEPPRLRLGNDARIARNQRMMVYEWSTVCEDVDEQVAILLAMTQRPDEVLGIAEYLELRERPMDALEIVRSAWTKRPSPNLSEFAAERLERQSQFAEALPYRWALMEAAPSRKTFDELMRAAGQAGLLNEWREKAMAYLEVKSRSTHLELLIEDGRLLDALQSARENGARLEHWEDLAEGYSAVDPRLAIELYFDCAEFALKERLEDNFISTAWQLAVDPPTFQVFRARLESFFQKNALSERYVARLIDGGIPVSKLLPPLDTKSRKD